ncbi:hypothetical protein [Methylobacterium sp. BTF04]|uniref:hypothetical protein n=1 Tax=Methylobacterium sp. BTF04 TaxID=2708300 RepID=UPI0032B19D03
MVKDLEAVKALGAVPVGSRAVVHPPAHSHGLSAALQPSARRLLLPASDPNPAKSGPNPDRNARSPVRSGRNRRSRARNGRSRARNVRLPARSRAKSAHPPSVRSSGRRHRAPIRSVRRSSVRSEPRPSVPHRPQPVIARPIPLRVGHPSRVVVGREPKRRPSVAPNAR